MANKNTKETKDARELVEEAGLHAVIDEEHGSLAIEGCSMDGPETLDESLRGGRVASVTTKDVNPKEQPKEPLKDERK